MSAGIRGPLPRHLRESRPVPLARVVEDLARIGRRLQSGEELPYSESSFYLRNGQVLRGVILDSGHDAAGTIVSVWLGGTDIAQLPLNVVDVIVRHDLAPIGADTNAQPSRLELRRKLSLAADQLRESAGVHLVLELDDAAGADDMGPIAALVDSFDVVVRHMAMDTLGRQALAQISAVRFAGGRSALLRRIGDVLLAVGAVGVADRWTDQELEVSLEQVL